MIRFADDFDPAQTRAVGRLSALAYGANLLPVSAALIARDDAVVWAWALFGSGLSLAVLAATLHQFDPRRKSPLSPRAVLVTNCLAFVATGSLSYGLSGSVGIFRLLLLCPLIMMMVVGNRTMVTISATVCLTVLAISTAATVASGLVVAVILAYGGGFLVVSAFVRELARSALRDAAQSRRFALLASMAARASSVEEGLDEMVPMVGAYLDASSVAIFPVRQKIVDAQAAAFWPDPEPTLTELERVDLRIAACDNRIVDSSNWSCFPISGPDRVQLVAIATHSASDIDRRSRHQSDVDGAATQLGVLLTRLDLIERLELLTRTDALTGLANRRCLDERLSHEIGVASRTGSQFSIVMVDLDHFKSYNDEFGHLAGDDLLKVMAAMMQHRLRSTDFIARYGGEEFCMVLPFTNSNQASIVVAEMHRRCSELDALRPVTFSAGISEWDGDETAEEVTERADYALYAAKEGGRNQTQIAQSWEMLDPRRIPTDPLSRRAT